MEQQADPQSDDEKLPVLFVLTLVLAALYVGYRVVQLLWWGIDAIF